MFNMARFIYLIVRRLFSQMIVSERLFGARVSKPPTAKIVVVGDETEELAALDPHLRNGCLDSLITQIAWGGLLVVILPE